MYDHFTDPAKEIMQLANQEAQRFNHECIGSDDILLGLLTATTAAVSDGVLKNLKVDIRLLRLEIERRTHRGPEMVTMGKLPHTPRAKKVIEYAMQEARELDHNYVGDEHILLGLIRDEGIPGELFAQLGIKIEKARAEVVRVLADRDLVLDLEAAREEVWKFSARPSYAPEHEGVPPVGLHDEHFTDRARKVMRLAREEAKRFGHIVVRPAHVLFGLIKEGSGVAANVIKNFGVSQNDVRLVVADVSATRAIETTAEEPAGEAAHTHLIIHYAWGEAVALHHTFIGTEHLLLGLLRLCKEMPKDDVCQVLAVLEIDVEQVRAEVLQLLGKEPFVETVAIPPSGWAAEPMVQVLAQRVADMQDYAAEVFRQLNDPQQSDRSFMNPLCSVIHHLNKANKVIAPFRTHE